MRLLGIYTILQISLLYISIGLADRSSQIAYHTDFGDIVISETFSPSSSEDSDGEKVDSSVFFYTKTKSATLLHCSNAGKGSSLRDIRVSGPKIAIKGACENLVYTLDGGKNWSIWNPHQNLYKNGFIEDFTMVSNGIEIKYAIPSSQKYDYWSIDGKTGKIQKQIK